MNKNRLLVARSASVVAAFVLLPLPAIAQCLSVDTLPAVLTEPGEYCLVEDLWFSDARGTAITIASDGVTLDLQGFELRGPHHGGVVTIPASRAIFADDAGGVTLCNQWKGLTDAGQALGCQRRPGGSGASTESIVILVFHSDHLQGLNLAAQFAAWEGEGVHIPVDTTAVDGVRQFP